MINALALVVAAFYSGAALYVTLVEKPALLALHDLDALAGWKVALKRGALIQAPLCVIGFLLGALAMLAGIPWTVAVILPINKSLLRATPEVAGAVTTLLLRDWYRRHAVRTALGLLALIAFFCGALNGSTLG